MNIRNWCYRIAIAASSSCALLPHAQAQSAVPAPADTQAPAGADPSANATATPVPQQKWLECDRMWSWLGSQCAGLKDAWYEGRPTLYLSGYTWHDPHTYKSTNLAALNDKSWGGGFGWSKTVANGDSFGWYAMAFRDSHYNITKSVGWTWLTYWPAGSDFAVGLGYTAFIASRPDIANNWPFPAALPIASIKVKDLEVIGTFVPKLNGGINHGNVASFFARYRF